MCATSEPRRDTIEFLDENDLGDFLQEQCFRLVQLGGEVIGSTTIGMELLDQASVCLADGVRRGLRILQRISSFAAEQEITPHRDGREAVKLRFKTTEQVTATEFCEFLAEHARTV